MATWIKVGTLRKSKKGGTYMKVDKDITLKKDSVLNVQDPRKKLEEAVSAGRMTESDANEIRAKIPEYILREVYFVEE